MKIAKKVDNFFCKNKQLFFIFFINILALSSLIVFSHIHYRADTYGIHLYGGSTHINSFLGSYRFFGAFVYWILSLMGHNPILNPLPDIIFYIVLSSVANTILVKYLYSLFNSEGLWTFIILELAVLITSVNVWFTDMLTFPECIIITAIGLFFCFLGVVIFASSKGKWGRLLSALFFIFSVATYQQFIPIFLIYITVVICIKQAKTQKSSSVLLFLHYIKTLVFFIITTVVYYLLAVLIQRILCITPNSRASLSLSTVIENIFYFIRQQHSFLKGREYFSSETLTVCYVLVIILFVISIIGYWRKTRDTLKGFCIVSSFFIAYVSAFFPGLISISHGTRTMCALFSVFALFSIGAISLYQKKWLVILLTTILFGVFSINVYKTVDMEIQQIIDNTKEKNYAECVLSEIEKYEKNTNILINKIGISYDKSRDFDSESLYESYAIESLLQMHAKNKITFIETPQTIFQSNFNDKDWKSFNEMEQMVFVKDTAYICVF